MKGLFWLTGMVGTLLRTPAFAQEVTGAPVADVESNGVPGFPKYLPECENDHCETGGGFAVMGIRWEGRERHLAGSEAFKLSVENFDGGNVTIRRTDMDDSIYSGMTAVYTGKLSGNRIDGTVTWNWPGHWDDPSVFDNWYAVARAVAFKDDPGAEDSDCAAVPGHREANWLRWPQGGTFGPSKTCRTPVAGSRRQRPQIMISRALLFLPPCTVSALESPAASEGWSWARTYLTEGYPLPEEVNLALQSAASGK